MYAIACILSYDGHAGLSTPPEYDSGGWEETPNSFLNSLFWSLSLKENKPSSSRSRNREHDFNSASTEYESMPRQQNHKQRNSKSANNADSGKRKEKMVVNHNNGIHQPEAAYTIKQPKQKSANTTGNKKENMPSDQTYGNQQLNTVPREATASMANNESSKITKTRLVYNSGPGKKKNRTVSKIVIHKRQQEEKSGQKRDV